MALIDQRLDAAARQLRAGLSQKPGERLVQPGAGCGFVEDDRDGIVTEIAAGQLVVSGVVIGQGKRRAAVGRGGIVTVA